MVTAAVLHAYGLPSRGSTAIQNINHRMKAQPHNMTQSTE